MSAAENKALIRSYLGAISGNAKPRNLLDRFIDDADAILKQHIAGAEAAFPHYEMLAEDLIAEDDRVVVRFKIRGTHQGDFMGIPATGRPIDVPGIIIYRIADGRIVEHWMETDAMSMMQQLGVQG
ncbi:MAG: ester cyclase [Caldilinea sp.]